MYLFCERRGLLNELQRQPLRTQQEINDFLFCLRRNKNTERDVFLFLIGINSGLRMSDIVKLKKQDLISSKNPRIIEKKTGKTRILYLSSLQDLIQEYEKDLDPEDYLFPSTKGGHLEVNMVYQMFQKVAKLLGRDDIGTHTLRKTFGYTLLQENQRRGYTDGNIRSQQ
ncbi:hypothetical protein B795N_21030 [Marinilactibacillus psychrotolerans]|nr:hypothetical protein B795N_21030 [Marinilactibacillus psychrotolerans]